MYLDNYPSVRSTFFAHVQIVATCAQYLPDDFTLTTESSAESPQLWNTDSTLTMAVINTVDMEYCELAWSLQYKDATDANAVYSDASSDFQAIYDETN